MYGIRSKCLGLYRFCFGSDIWWRPSGIALAVASLPDELWMLLKTKPTWSRLRSPSFWRQKAEPAPIKSRPAQGQQRRKGEWVNNWTDVFWSFDNHESLMMTRWDHCQAEQNPDFQMSHCNEQPSTPATNVRLELEGTDCQGDESHCDAGTSAAAILIDWVSNWSATTRQREKKARSALIIRWFMIVSGFLFLIWFMIPVSVVSAWMAGVLWITECGCAQSHSTPVSPLHSAQSAVDCFTSSNAQIQNLQKYTNRH